MLHAGILRAYEAGIQRLANSAGLTTVQASAAAEAAQTQARAAVFTTDAQTFFAQPELSEEVFGPSTIVVNCASQEELARAVNELQGHLTATIHGTAADLEEYRWLISALELKVGRIVINGFPTGVEVCPSMTHGGPYPATTDARSTSVGTDAIKRFVRPVSYQGFPNEALPPALQDSNPLGIWRRVNGEFVKDQ
jgi:NADP-dependent aldehyde dehydrogenase